MFTTKEELASHMHIETIEVITDGDDAIVQGAIDGAVSEARGYLQEYNADAIFSETGDRRNSLLLTFIKDMAVWHLVVLSNYNADIELREKRYDRAVAWLKGVQKGDITPDLPRATEVKGPVRWGSNPKKTQHF